MFHQKLTPLVSAVLAVILVGSVVGVAAVTVDSSSPTAATPQAAQQSSQASSYLRVVHASPDAPAVDVYVEGDTVLENVSFGQVSEYLSLPPGEYDVAITVAGDDEAIIFEEELTFEAGSVTTVAAAGEVSEDAATSFAPVLLSDDAMTPDEDEAAVRVVHLSPDAPAVDITVEGTDVVLADNVSFGNASEYVTVPAGDYTVEIRAATETNDGPVVTTVDVSLEGGQAYSAFAVGYLNPEEAPADTPFQVGLTQDATTEIHTPTMNETETGTTTAPTTETTAGTETAVGTETTTETTTETM